MAPDSPIYQVRGQHITHERLDDEVIAIDLDRGYYFAMVGPAADIWTALVAGAELAAVAAVLAPRYDVDPSVVQHDLDVFVRTLLDDGLVVAREAPDDRDPDHVVALPDLAVAVGWSTPELERYDDMADLVLLDPIHQVDESGWPHLPPES